jgi:hypothetical protein
VNKDFRVVIGFRKHPRYQRLKKWSDPLLLLVGFGNTRRSIAHRAACRIPMQAGGTETHALGITRTCGTTP